MPEKTNVPQFAVVNVAELLERSAYYGFTSVFGLYLAGLGYSGAAIGAISVILLAFPYAIPLLSGALAEKIGYKPMMVGALVLYTSGFAVLFSFSSLEGILAGVLLIATGAGGFKPIATASVAHVTSESQRSFGYTIYYTGINVGGFVGPLAVAFLSGSRAAGFAVSGVLIAVAFLLTAIAFRNPVPPQREASVGQALAKLGSIFHDLRLLVLLLIFSGFWFLYSMNFSFVALYLDRFVALPDWFEANLQQAFNPLVIILLGIPLGALATKRAPVPVMTAGIGLYLVGFSLVAFVPVFPAFLAGLFIATVGEILAYPAFLAYLSRIAPPDRIAVYQSYGFIPIFLGFFFGPLLTGPVYQAIAVEAGRPGLFWVVPLAAGVLALAGFLLMAARDAKEAKPRRIATARALAVLLLIPLFAAVGAAVSPAPLEQPEPALEGREFTRQPGTTAEGAMTERILTLPAGVAGNLSVELTWSDEPAGLPGTSNAPDTLKLRLASSGVPLAEQEASNPPGQQGRIVLTIPASSVRGNLTVQVSVLSAGEVQTNGITVAQDTGNSWQLVVAGQVQAATS